MLMKILLQCDSLVQACTQNFSLGGGVDPEVTYTLYLKLCYQNHVINISICFMTHSRSFNHRA